MKSVTISAVTIATVLLSTFTGCSQKTVEFKGGETPGMKDPSIRIQAKHKTTDIKGASFGWGMEVYKIPAEYTGAIAAASRRIKSGLTRQLVGKGMRLATGEPDYLVSFAVGTGCEINQSEIDEAYLDLLGGRLEDVPGELLYKQGVMIVDVVARESKELIWRGAIMAEIDMEWPEERKQERSDAVARELLKHFPEP